MYLFLIKCFKVSLLTMYFAFLFFHQVLWKTCLSSSQVLMFKLLPQILLIANEENHFLLKVLLAVFPSRLFMSFSVVSLTFSIHIRDQLFCFLIKHSVVPSHWWHPTKIKFAEIIYHYLSQWMICLFIFPFQIKVIHFLILAHLFNFPAS